MIQLLKGENMIIKFEDMDFVANPNFKGGEKQLDAKMFFDGVNRIMSAKLVPGASIGLHTHDGGSEIIFVLTGAGKVLIDGGEERVRAGECHYCPKGHTHSLINDGKEDLTFYAVVAAQ